MTKKQRQLMGRFRRFNMSPVCHPAVDFEPGTVILPS